MDKWQDDILYYTGTDAGSIAGSQTLRGIGNNNGSLKGVWDEPVESRKTLFLFIKYARNECTYKGIVELASQPYQEPRPSNPKTTVWKFPLRLKSTVLNPSSSPTTSIEKNLHELSDRVLRNKAKAYSGKISNTRKITTTYHDRSPIIAEYAKRRANGICDLCGCPAPFEDSNHIPYLEAHHVTWLSKGGTDTIDNVVALCPNCHRKIHILNLSSDNTKLKDKLNKYSF